MRQFEQGLIALLFGVITSIVWAGVVTADIETMQRSLIGLRGVGVVVEEVRPYLTDHNLASATIETTVTLRLRQEGIRVLSDDEMLADEHHSYLYVRLSCACEGTDLAVPVALDVQLWQEVQLIGKLSRPVSGCTWYAASRVGYYGLNKLDDGARGMLRDELDEFVNAWLATHPKPAR